MHNNEYCCSAAKSYLTLCDSMDCSTPAFPVLTVSDLLNHMSIVSMTPPNHLILWCPLLLLPSTFPNIRVFFNESALHKWPKYWRIKMLDKKENRPLSKGDED